MAQKAVWGLDIGQSSLKAVRGQKTGAKIEILAFDCFEYNLTNIDNEAEVDAAIRQALTTFLGRYDVSGDDVLVSAPAHSALIRFIRLPPVDRKKIKDIVRYEAHQQIPFPLEEVIWDYQAIDRGFLPGEEVEVGIFAMRKEIIHRFLSNLMLVNLESSVLQVAPIALYNFLMYERPPSAGAIIVIDVGANNTDLLIISQDRIWTRNLPIAGNDLTNAIAREFNLPFEKAETLKRKAAKSKFQAKIYEAMKPALKGLIDELQRSVGYYKSVNAGQRIDHILVMGSAFKLPGLGRFLLNNLQYEVRKLSSVQNYITDNAMNIDQYRENPMGFGPSLGLVTQGLGLGSMNTNLMPEEILYRRVLARKKPWAFVAAGILMAMVGINYLQAKSLEAKYKGAMVQSVQTQVQPIVEATQRYQQALSSLGGAEGSIDKYIGVGANRNYWFDVFNAVFKPIKPEPPIVEGPDGKVIPPPFDSRNKIWIRSFQHLSQTPGALSDMSITLLIDIVGDMAFFKAQVDDVYRAIPFLANQTIVQFPEKEFPFDEKTNYINPMGVELSGGGVEDRGMGPDARGGPYGVARGGPNVGSGAIRLGAKRGRRITYAMTFSAEKYQQWLKDQAEAARKKAEAAQSAPASQQAEKPIGAADQGKAPASAPATQPAAPAGGGQ